MDIEVLFRLTVLFTLVHVILGVIPSLLFARAYWKVQGKEYVDKVFENFTFYLSFAWKVSLIMTLLILLFYLKQFIGHVIVHMDVIYATGLYFAFTLLLWVIDKHVIPKEKRFAHV